MFLTIPRVEGARLYQSETSADTIIVGTAAWYDWLEQHTAFTFVDRIFGFFLARKRRRASGELTWEASHVRAPKLYRVLLGPSHTLTLSKLQSVAQTLAGPYVPAEWADTSPSEPVASQSQTPEPAVPRGSLMRTKLYLPRSGNDVIPRIRLIERLNAGLSGKVTLVCAPAGFGKTTLLVEWLRTFDRPTAWLSLDENDNELPIFVHSLVAALQSAVPVACQATVSLLNAPLFPSSAEVANLLIDDLADMPEDVVLVLDDYHLIRNRDVHGLLEVLIAHLPPQVHLVLATRSALPLPLLKWQAMGYLSELCGADLRFTLQETEAFLARVLGNDLAQQLAEQMENWTEGWIAVVRLAVLSLHGSADPATFLERLRSQPDRSVSRYLLEEILVQQAPAVQELLERASLLEQCCAELGAAMLGRAASAEQVQTTLEWLERSNAFLISLDDQQRWYRLHHLFQGLLQQRLREHASAEELATLHQRASAWYAGQGLIDEALHHALAAGDAPGAARLLEAQVLWAYEHERTMQMERWLRQLPEEQVWASPSLLFAKAWILQAHGQITDFPRLLAAAERLLAARDKDGHHRDEPHRKLLHALIAIGWSHFQLFTGQAQASLQSARCALHWLPPAEAHLRSQAMQYLAWSTQASGQEDVALAALHQALRELPARPTITPNLLFAQALVFLAAGKLPQVEQTARHLLQLAQEADLAVAHSWAHALLGIVLYEWNRPDEVVEHCSAVLANRHQAHFWALSEAMCTLACAYQAQGLGAQAQETADALLALTQEQHNVGEMMAAYAFRGQLALLNGEVEEAEPWLELAGEPEVLGPMLVFEDLPIIRARLLLAKGDQASLARGQALLTHLLHHVEAMHSTRKTIQVLALQAWAYDLQGRQTESLDVLERALALGRPAGFVRTFVDLPQLARVLDELRKRRKSHQVVDSKLDAYLQRVLVAMNTVAAHTSSREELLCQEGLESLTERELCILGLLDKDLSNKEIACELVITPGTVKVHTNNLYRKLSVNNRRAAVGLSKALGLLAAD